MTDSRAQLLMGTREKTGELEKVIHMLQELYLHVLDSR